LAATCNTYKWLNKIVGTAGSRNFAGLFHSGPKRDENETFLDELVCQYDMVNGWVAL
jgi:hypothetical protein